MVVIDITLALTLAGAISAVAVFAKGGRGRDEFALSAVLAWALVYVVVFQELNIGIFGDLVVSSAEYSLCGVSIFVAILGFLRLGGLIKVRTKRTKADDRTAEPKNKGN